MNTYKVYNMYLHSQISPSQLVAQLLPLITTTCTVCRNVIRSNGFHIVNDPWTCACPNVMLTLSVVPLLGKRYCIKQEFPSPRIVAYS